MTRIESIFLDLLRVLAALIVMLGHFEPIGWWTPINGEYAHDAVIVFFVISGYMVACTNNGSERTLQKFILSRLTRIYSVAIPALAYTALVASIIYYYEPAYYQIYDRGYFVLRLILTAGMLQQIWTWSSDPTFNQPFWSLAFEFWYYAIFGVIRFVSSHRAKIFLLLAIAALIGPKILLLLPVWVCGWALFHFSQQHLTTSKNTRICALLACIWLIFYLVFTIRWPEVPAPRPLFHASAFLSDLATAISLCIILFHLSIAYRNRVPSKYVEVKVKSLAGMSFTLYLWHMPTMMLLDAVRFNTIFNKYVSLLLAVTIVFIVTRFAFLAFENKRHLVHKWLTMLVQKHSSAQRSRPNDY